ncbi:hypothetical protein HMPREF1022_01433 [Desulfovibrio sp. 6_1_46AFAA]|uniref:TRAP transporter large permease n=1 Tax=Desulfovibrio sp. 6_1_46AFAA TaxID=665942 RepID=UPI000223710D|nr:TRAP transporter large permease [Desulfovibrio sp. 6_1_46AFAA]EGW51587.1 hypothetical protein HMPREF1022_01433 [Desulfovibrio sp. 6_1_46AFAA]
MNTLLCVMTILLLLFLLGVPIFMSLIASTIIALLISGDLSTTVIQNSLFDGLNSFPLLAIPCFVVAGTLMEKGNITNQIIEVVKQIFGRMHGGLGITTVLACAFFAAISGSGPGTVAAIGTLLIPAMVRNGYSSRYAASVASSGGTIGILIPPSNPMIIYGIVGNISITGLFTAGFIPGFIIAAALAFTAWISAKRQGFSGDASQPPFNARVFIRTCLKNSFALLTPFIILGSIYSGICTPVEASVVAVAWALFVGFVVNRHLSCRDIYNSLLEGAMICGVVLLIVGASTLFGKLLTIEQAPMQMTNLFLSISENKTVILLLIIGLLLILGMFLETLATIIILAPVLLPVVTGLGVDPIHFGVILVVTNEVALLTPPVGVNLFVSSRIAHVPVESVARGVLPYLAALLCCVLLITFIPAISTWLPHALGYGK